MATRQEPEHPMAETLRAIFGRCCAIYGEAETRKIWKTIAGKRGRPAGSTDAFRDYILMAGLGLNTLTGAVSANRALYEKRLGKPNFSRAAHEAADYERQTFLQHGKRDLVNPRKFAVLVKANEKRARRLWVAAKDKRKAAPDEAKLSALLEALRAILLEANKLRLEPYLLAIEARTPRKKET
jgi:hypothetical protein